MPRTLTRGRARNTAPVQEPDDVDNDETEEEQEEAPRSRRAPRSTGRRAPLHTDEDDDEEDEAPRGRRKRSDSSKEEASSRKAGSGWGTYAAQKKSGGDYAENFKMGDDGEETLIKFLDTEPFAVYDQHWFNELDGKKSFECLQPDEDCPLCDDLGDKPRTQVAFNILDLTDFQRPAVKVWTVGPQVADTLKNFAQNKRTSPLDRDNLYFAVSRTKKKNKRYETTVTPVKSSDLAEDWDIENPLTDDEIAEYREKAYGPDIIKFPTRKRLLEIVDELLDD